MSVNPWRPLPIDAEGAAASSLGAAALRDQETHSSKKHVLLSQVFMTFIMAASMSGLMGLIIVGPSMDWLAGWPLQFLIAWPIAFALTMVAWPASMKLAAATLRPRQERAVEGA